MRRAPKIVVVCAFVLSSSQTVGAPAARVGAALGNVHPLTVARPGLGPRQVAGHGVGSTNGLRIVRGDRLRRTGFGGDYAGLGLAGLGYGALGYDAGQGYGGPLPSDAGFEGPPPAPYVIPPPCLPSPLIIKVGPGLQHAARTRVLYGPPTCGAS